MCAFLHFVAKHNFRFAIVSGMRYLPHAPSPSSYHLYNLMFRRKCRFWLVCIVAVFECVGVHASIIQFIPKYRISSGSDGLFMIITKRTCIIFIIIRVPFHSIKCLVFPHCALRIYVLLSVQVRKRMFLFSYLRRGVFVFQFLFFYSEYKYEMSFFVCILLMWTVSLWIVYKLPFNVLCICMKKCFYQYFGNLLFANKADH